MGAGSRHHWAKIGRINKLTNVGGKWMKRESDRGCKNLEVENVRLAGPIKLQAQKY